jgi:hypothetical protein
MTKIDENKTQASSGVLVGLGKELYFRPVFGILSAKVAMYSEMLNISSGLKVDTDGFNVLSGITTWTRLTN